MSPKYVPKDLHEYVETFLPSMLPELNIPGAAIAVVKDGQVLVQAGVGFRDVENKIPVDCETLFAIGSTSKAFTATILGQLVDEGKLGWNDPVIKYVPEFRTKDPVASVQMTIKDIMCHRSGLPRHDLSWLFSPVSRQELLEKIQYFEPFAPFRSAFYYNNYMWLVAGIVGERITGKSWEENVCERIFKPLGMQNANCSVDDTQKADNFAHPYTVIGGKIEKIPFRNIDPIGPAGSINAHIADYIKWLMLNLGKGEFEGKRVISAASLAEIHAPQMAIEPANEIVAGFSSYKELSNMVYTLGWVSFHYRGHQMLMHAGGIDGFSAFLAFLPNEGVGAAVLTNLGGTTAHYGIAWELIDRVLGSKPINWAKQIFDGEQKKKAEAAEGSRKMEAMQVKDTQPSHPLEAYVGEYMDPGYGPLSLKLENGIIQGTFNSLAFELKHFHYDIFMMHPKVKGFEDVKIPVSFLTGMDGSIVKALIPMEPATPPIEFVRKN